MPVKPIRDGYQPLTPYLVVRGAAAAIEFYKTAFHATEVSRMADPSGQVGHAELEIAGCKVTLSDEFPEMGYSSPQTLGGFSSGLMLYVPDVDAVYERAVAAGATVVKPVKDQFYGDRSGGFTDPFGHFWTVATHIEDVSHEEIERRIAALFPPKTEAA